MKLKTVSTIFKVVEIVLCSIGFICCVIPNNSSANMTGIVFFIIACIVAIAYLLYRMSGSGIKKLTEQNKEYDSYYTFLSDTRGANRLIIRKRGSLAQKAIKINAKHEIHCKEIPDKLIYTGATVGGITTGGFHVQKGGTQILMGKKTGQYYLSYELLPSYQNTSGIIVFIILNDSDFEELNKTELSQLVATKEEKDWYKISDKNVIDVRDLSQNQAKALVSWLSLM